VAASTSPRKEQGCHNGSSSAHLPLQPAPVGNQALKLLGGCPALCLLWGHRLLCAVQAALYRTAVGWQQQWQPAVPLQSAAGQGSCTWM